MSPKRGGPAIRPPDVRFWEKVRKQDDGGCWIWTGARKGRKGYESGYGFFYAGLADVPGSHRVVNAHRFAYELEIGSIPEGNQLDHLCKNPPCVNPAHLEPMTRSELRRRYRLEYCKRGHPMDEINAYNYRGGGRRCRKCHAMRQRRYNKAARG